MNIEGLDYNTQRERLILPEYGRGVQSMVDYAMTIEDREERRVCAENIVAIMEKMSPQNRENPDYKRKLWDHLAIMSRFSLDIDYPYDVSGARKITTKPEPVAYPMTRIPARHYGKLVFDVLERLKTMEPGKERDELIRLVANRMKRNLHQWGHGVTDDGKVIEDIERYTDGAVKIEPGTLKTEPVNDKEYGDKKKKKR